MNQFFVCRNMIHGVFLVTFYVRQEFSSFALFQTTIIISPKFLLCDFIVECFFTAD